MSLIRRCIGRMPDGAGVYEIGEPVKYICGWSTGSLLRQDVEGFDTREAAELAWEIAPQPMNLTASSFANMLRPGIKAVWDREYL